MRRDTTITIILIVGGLALLWWILSNAKNRQFIFGGTSPADVLGRLQSALDNRKKPTSGRPNSANNTIKPDDDDDDPDEASDSKVKVYEPPPPPRSQKKPVKKTNPPAPPKKTNQSLDSLIENALGPRRDYPDDTAPESKIKMYEPPPTRHERKPPRVNNYLDDLFELDVPEGGENPILKGLSNAWNDLWGAFANPEPSPLQKTLEGKPITVPEILRGGVRR